MVCLQQRARAPGGARVHCLTKGLALTLSEWSPKRVLHREVRWSGLLSDSLIDF